MFSRGILLMVSVSVCVVAPANEFAVSKHQGSVIAATQVENDIQYKKGLLTGVALDQPIMQMLAAIGRSANLEIEYHYKPENNETVSYQLKNVRLRVALKDLLENYSYLFIPAEEEKAPGKLILLDRKNGGNGSRYHLQTDINVDAKHKERDAVGEVQVPSEEGRKNTPGLRSLDDFLSLEELAPKLAYGAESEEQRMEREDQEARYAEALLQRALAVLETSYDNLYGQALAALQGMDAPEAVAALLEAAQGGYAKSADLQFFAAEALSHHAADLGYKNQLANDALKQLKDSKIPAVREVAAKALSDMRYAQKKQDGIND